MSNGYRRGGSYTRNGKTFTRRGTTIKAPRGFIVAAGIGVGAAALFGSGSVLTVGIAIFGVGTVVAYRYRRQLRPVTRKLGRRFRWVTKTTRDPNKTGLGVTTSTWWKQGTPKPTKYDYYT